MSFFKGTLVVEFPRSWASTNDDIELAYNPRGSKAAVFFKKVGKWFILWQSPGDLEPVNHIEVVEKLPEGFEKGKCPYVEPYHVAMLFGISHNHILLHEYV